MKLITYSKDNVARCGVLADDGIVDIASVWDGKDWPQSVIEILQRGPACTAKLSELIKTAKDLIPIESVKLLAPIPRPGKIIALAGNYSEHIKEACTNRGFKLGLSDSPRETTVPRPFIMPSTAVANPGDEIPWPVYSETIDYELELAVVIGRTVKCIEAEDAINSIAGYTIVNDVSARSVTFAANRAKRPWDEFYDWLNGKWADGFCPMGRTC